MSVLVPTAPRRGLSPFLQTHHRLSEGRHGILVAPQVDRRFCVFVWRPRREHPGSGSSSPVGRPDAQAERQEHLLDELGRIHASRFRTRCVVLMS